MTPFNRPSVHSPTHPFTHPFIHPLIHSPTHPFTYPFIHPIIRSSTHPCIHVDGGGGEGGEGVGGGVEKGGEGGVGEGGRSGGGRGEGGGDAKGGRDFGGMLVDGCLRESSWLVAAVVSAATLHGAHGAEGMPSSIHPSPDAVEYSRPDSTESTSCSGYGWKLLRDRMVARFWWVVCIILPIRVPKCLPYTITVKARWSDYWSPTLVHPSFWPATSRSWIWRRYQPALACSRWSVNQHFYFCPGLGWERL